MRNSPRFCALQWSKTDRAPFSKTQRKSPETQRFQGFSNGRGRRARSCFATPLAVPEKIFGLPLFLDFFDRCANPCSLYPPPAALAGVARHAPRASGSSLFRETKKSPRKAETFLFGRGRRARTLGTRFWRPLLYQLSYAPICDGGTGYFPRNHRHVVGLQGLEPGTDRL